MFILFIRGVTLPGAMTGIRYYLIPDIEKLKDITVSGRVCRGSLLLTLALVTLAEH